MTVVVATASPDGIVLASDSRTIEATGAHVRVSSDSTEKVYLAGTYGIATYGRARVGDQTIRGLMDEFETPEDGDPERCATELGKFFHGHVMAVAPPPKRGGGLRYDPGWRLGFLVAGYDSGGTGLVFHVGVRSVGDVSCDKLEIGTANPGVVYLGDAADALERMIDGVDRRRLRSVTFDKNVSNELDKLRYDWIHPNTVTDAIELARFLADTAISMRRFSDGTLGERGSLPSAGGPVQLLAITRSTYRWVTKLGIDRL